MDRLSAHFTLGEFAVSASHPALVVPVPLRYVPQLKKLVDTVIEPLREEFGAAIRVLSGFRNWPLNTAIGGTSTSQHLVAEAADLTPADGHRKALALFDILRARAADGAPLPHGQCIWYPAQNFMHVALPSGKYREPTFCVHFPARGMRYRVVEPTTDVAHLARMAA